MDIEMMFMDGMTAAGKIRAMDSEVIIIFITNMPQYVIEGYKVDALDYVLKPLTYFALSQRIDRALSRLQRRTKQFITIGLKAGMQKVNISRIKYIEVQNHDSIIYTLDGNFTTKETLKNLEDSIGSNAFFRCNKCYLVNLEFVDGIQNYDIMIGNDLIQVSRARKKEFMDALNDYINEVSK
jgi:DNA-binding LytR/AlgR family response regulator